MAYQNAGLAYQGTGFSYQVATASPVSDEQPSGGWLFLNSYEAHLQRKKERERRRRELEEESEQIQNDIDRNIALLLREQEAIDEKKKEGAELVALARQDADLSGASAYSERVAKAFARVLVQENYSAIEALERELRKSREEEEMLLAIMLAISDD